MHCSALLKKEGNKPNDRKNSSVSANAGGNIKTKSKLLVQQNNKKYSVLNEDKNCRSSSFSKTEKDVERVPKASKLHYEDFWPQCLNPMEQNIKSVQFETFE